jgi:hypothetical protein
MRHLRLAYAGDRLAPPPRRTEPSIPVRFFVRWVSRILSANRPRLLLIRSGDRLASAILIREFLDRRTGPACVVADPTGMPEPYFLPITSVLGWRVVLSSEVPGDVDEVARSMGAANTLVLDHDNDQLVRALWLPPSVLAGYASLPVSSDAVLVVDDWSEIESAYLAVPPRELVWRPDRLELDRLLVDAFRVLSGSHLVLVTTRSSPVLEEAADAILDVRRDTLDGEVEARIARDCVDPTPDRR